MILDLGNDITAEKEDTCDLCLKNGTCISFNNPETWIVDFTICLACLLDMVMKVRVWENHNAEAD